MQVGIPLWLTACTLWRASAIGSAETRVYLGSIGW
jgi:hypothetical protein